MNRIHISLWFFLALVFLLQTSALNVLNLRIDVPSPDGSGVAVVELKADPLDPEFGQLTGFNITSFTPINPEQSFRLWTGGACSGTYLDGASSLVPAEGLLCFSSNTSTGPLEFQNSFTYVALGGATQGNTGTVTLLNYNKQLCPGIPDLGPSSSFRAPPSPSVSITLSGLQIHFAVTATYIRNQTTWLLDFWDFNAAAGADLPDGSDRSCSNQRPTNHVLADFSSWWFSAPRSTYTSSIDASIDSALNDGAVYPNYAPTPDSGRWTISAVDCSHVLLQATIPVSNLIRNLTSDCHHIGDVSAAATSSGGLDYNGALYVNALRPVSTTDSTSGFFKSSFVFPFSFSLQTTVSNIVGTSAKWSFIVSVLNSVVTYTGANPSFTLDLQTSIFSPSLTSPTVAQSGFSLPSFPLAVTRTGASALPVLTRLGDNGNCGTPQACIISWRMEMPQLSLAELLGSQTDFNTQYVGKYSFRWETLGGDILSADVYMDVSAANPSTNLTQIPVNSSLNFFASQETMQTTTNAGLTTPLYNSGEKIWVRHSFLVDAADIKAFLFTLTTAYICTSNVPGFIPSITAGGTGCSSDIPGVMEASQRQRFLLFDASSLNGGIVDVPGSPSEQETIWGWTPVVPTDAGWTDLSTVNNGFGINAQPLAVDGSQRTWYFHLISTVTQPALGRSLPTTRVIHQLVRASANSGAIQSVSVVQSSTSDSAAATLSPSFAPLLNIIKSNL